MSLLDGKLLLSNPFKFNDPFDSALDFNHDDLTEVAARERLSSSGSISDRICARTGSSEDCFLAVKKARARKSEQYRMFCMSESWDSRLMWSHYCLGHNGICIKLSLDLSTLPLGHILEPVRYTTHYPELKGEDVENDNPDALRTLLLTKSVDWLYEKEWRYIAPSKDCKRDSVVCKNWLKIDAVYIGMRLDESAMRDFIHSFFCGEIRDNFAFVESKKLQDEFFKIQKNRVLDWIKTDNQQEIMRVFGGNGAIDRFKELDARDKVLTKLREAKVSLHQCQKSSDKFELEKGF